MKRATRRGARTLRQLIRRALGPPHGYGVIDCLKLMLFAAPRTPA